MLLYVTESSGMGMMRRTLTTTAALLLLFSVSNPTTTLAQQILIDDFELTTNLGTNSQARTEKRDPSSLSPSRELFPNTKTPQRFACGEAVNERCLTPACQWLEWQSFGKVYSLSVEYYSKLTFRLVSFSVFVFVPNRRKWREKCLTPSTSFLVCPTLTCQYVLHLEFCFVS
jgi:hypothetical protein